ncbi:MAG TPA: flagellar hook capping FlgD N-terminal domain-containing protein [Sphingobacteriaceae bacterium]|nr:flagellar hook capping FlgD N-terminal domain-containing protein [Sphingobacteriaceae bacterium]
MVVTSGLAGVNGSAGSALTGETGGPGASRILEQSGLGRDQFLQLLVAQLRHQDPMEPLDARSFVAELAQFASLEALHRVDEGLVNLNDSLHQWGREQAQIHALNLLGRTVELRSGLMGQVQRVAWGEGGLRLGLEDDLWVDLSEVVQVANPINPADDPDPGDEAQDDAPADPVPEPDPDPEPGDDDDVEGLGPV